MAGRLSDPAGALELDSTARTASSGARRTGSRTAAVPAPALEHDAAGESAAIPSPSRAHGPRFQAATVPEGHEEQEGAVNAVIGPDAGADLGRGPHPAEAEDGDRRADRRRSRRTGSRTAAVPAPALEHDAAGESAATPSPSPAHGPRFQAATVPEGHEEHEGAVNAVIGPDAGANLGRGPHPAEAEDGDLEDSDAADAAPARGRLSDPAGALKLDSTARMSSMRACRTGSTTGATALRALRARCWDCAGEAWRHARDCDGGAGTRQGLCPLHPFRPGVRVKGAGSRLKALRRYCVACMGGDRSLVTDCPSRDCPLWPLRFGRRAAT